MSPDFDDQYVELRQGDYWRAFKESKYIPKGQVHLLKSIRDVEGKAHTIILAGHPGEECSGYKFLVEEFLAHFEPLTQEKAERVRQEELAAIQGKVTDLQAEMSRAATDPKLITARIEPGIREWETKQNVEAGATDTLPFIDPGHMQLVPTMTADDVNKTRLAIARRGEEARLTAEWFGSKAKELSTTVNQMVPYMKEKAEAALARTEDVRRFVERLQKGVASLDLYVGTGVNVIEIKRGASAPDTVKLAVQQSKLFIDEELAVWADVDEEFNWRDLDKFRETLANSPGLVNQMFPSERAIICVATTEQHKEYPEKMSAIEIDMHESLNRQVFLLVRDGENIYQVVSPVESHMKSKRLFPSHQEIEEIFSKDRYRFRTSPGQDKDYIPFMHVEYTDRLEEHDSVALHYRRFLFLMAGLDHRLNLFGRFHNKPQSMEFLSAKFQAEFMDFIHDDDPIGLRITGEKLETFEEYVKRHNQTLRSGSRVVCQWKDVVTPHTAPSIAVENTGESRYRGNGYWFRVRFLEKNSVRIVYLEEGALCVKAPVKRDSYRSDARFEATITLSRYRRDYYGNGLGFLVLDQVKAEELDAFIHNRVERRNFLDYLRMFKTAIKYLRGEEERQKPTRDKLVVALVDAALASGAAAEEIVDKAIVTWRASNRGAELPEPSAPGYKQLLNQMFELAQQDTLVAQMETFAAERGVSPVRLVVSGKSKLTLYTTPKPEERDDRLFPHQWVHQLRLKRNKTGFSVEGDAWVVLPEVSATETTLYEWPEAQEWIGLNPPVSFADKQEAFGLLDHQIFPAWLKEKWTASDFEWRFEEWRRVRDNLNRAKRSGPVENPGFALPLTLLYATHADKKKSRFTYLALEADVATFLYHHAPDEAAKERLMKEYVRWYLPRVHEDRRKKLMTSKPNFALTTLKIDAEIQGHMIETWHFQPYPVTLENLPQEFTKAVAKWKKDRRDYVRMDDAPVEVLLHFSPMVLDRLFGGKIPMPEEIVAPESTEEESEA